MADKTKIDWADATWNPVTGCFHDCPYCYARGIAHRYGLPYAPKLGDPGMEGAAKWDSDEGMDTMLELEKPYVKDGRKQPYPMGFNPTFHRYRLGIPAQWERLRNIFVCSMADLFGDWVPDEWIQDVFEACLSAPQHRYLFLTKNPNRYFDLAERGVLPMERNFWWGSSVTKTKQQYFVSDKHNTFLSIEPILEPLGESILHYPKWVIIGAETGNRKEKVIPEKAWIDSIADRCREESVFVFMKESLRGIMGADFRQEFPWEA